MIERSKKSFEFDGVNVEEAINKALKVLNISREEINIKIVCEEKKGLFGMEGAKPAKIKIQFKKNIKNSWFLLFLLENNLR